MYNINLSGLPDFSNIDFGNIDLSQFGVPTPAAVAPVQPPVLPAATSPAPAPAPVPAFDPYAGMTQADLAEIGMAAPMPQMVAPPVQTPALAPELAVNPAPEPVQPAPSMGIEGLAPNFAMTKDFSLPVERGPDNLPVATTMAMGEEDGGFPPERDMATTMAMGEEDGGGMATTMAMGEEDGGGMATTMAMGEEDGGYFADLDPNSPARNAETLGGTPDVNNVAQSLINTGPITLPNGETFDIRDLDLTGLDLSGFTPPQEAINEAQGTTPARGARAGEDLARIPGGYFAPASDYYTDGQLADRGIEPGTTVSTGANPQQPAGTPLNLSPEQQAAIDNWLANNPPGTVINLPGGGSVTVPDYTSPTRTVNSNDFMLQNLQIQQGQGRRGGSVATQFGLRGIAPTQPVQRGNPFRRPGDEGIASLVPSGG
jgi:hypothetical protein